MRHAQGIPKTSVHGAVPMPKQGCAVADCVTVCAFQFFACQVFMRQIGFRSPVCASARLCYCRKMTPIPTIYMLTILPALLLRPFAMVNPAEFTMHRTTLF